MNSPNKNYNKLYTNIIICIFGFYHQIYADSKELNEWGVSSAKIETGYVNIEKIDLNTTILGNLIKDSGKKIHDLLEPGKKTVKTFKITYPISIKNIKKEIKQYGIVKTLPDKVQAHINKHPSWPLSLQYKVDNPVFIRLISGGETFDAPLLLSDIKLKNKL